MQLRLHWFVTFSTIVVSGNGASGITLGVLAGRRVHFADRLHAHQLAHRRIERRLVREHRGKLVARE